MYLSMSQFLYLFTLHNEKRGRKVGIFEIGNAYVAALDGALIRASYQKPHGQ